MRAVRLLLVALGFAMSALAPSQAQQGVLSDPPEVTAMIQDAERINREGRGLEAGVLIAEAAAALPDDERYLSRRRFLLSLATGQIRYHSRLQAIQSFRSQFPALIQEIEAIESASASISVDTAQRRLASHSARLAAEPQSADVRLVIASTLARSLARSGRYREAASELQEALAEARQRANAYFIDDQYRALIGYHKLALDPAGITATAVDGLDWARSQPPQVRVELSYAMLRAKNYAIDVYGSQRGSEDDWWHALTLAQNSLAHLPILRAAPLCRVARQEFNRLGPQDDRLQIQEMFSAAWADIEAGPRDEALAGSTVSICTEDYAYFLLSERRALEALEVLEQWSAAYSIEEPAQWGFYQVPIRLLIARAQWESGATDEALATLGAVRDAFRLRPEFEGAGYWRHDLAVLSASIYGSIGDVEGLARTCDPDGDLIALASPQLFALVCDSQLNLIGGDGVQALEELAQVGAIDIDSPYAVFALPDQVMAALDFGRPELAAHFVEQLRLASAHEAARPEYRLLFLQSDALLANYQDDHLRSFDRAAAALEVHNQSASWMNPSMMQQRISQHRVQLNAAINLGRFEVARNLILQPEQWLAQLAQLDQLPSVELARYAASMELEAIAYLMSVGNTDSVGQLLDQLDVELFRTAPAYYVRYIQVGLRGYIADGRPQEAVRIGRLGLGPLVTDPGGGILQFSESDPEAHVEAFIEALWQASLHVHSR